MDKTAKTYSIVKIEGDVLVHHALSGWVRAREGMEFDENVRITVKTGKNGVAHVVNADGLLLRVTPRSLNMIDGRSTEEDLGKLRFVKVNARVMKAARTWERLAPAM
jgi:hypothetical protein